MTWKPSYPRRLCIAFGDGMTRVAPAIQLSVESPHGAARAASAATGFSMRMIVISLSVSNEFNSLLFNCLMLLFNSRCLTMFNSFLAFLGMMVSKSSFFYIAFRSPEAFSTCFYSFRLNIGDITQAAWFTIGLP